MPEDVGVQVAGFLHKLGHLRKFSSDGRPALHKPLLLLYALAEFKQRRRETVSFRETDSVVTPLLKKYGPTGTSARVSDPFVRLESDGIWEIRTTNRDELFDRSGNARPGILSKNDTEAGFSGDVLALLRTHPGPVDNAARTILDTHIPAGIQKDVLDSVGWEQSR